MPTQTELSGLYSSGAINGQGWALRYTWSSTASVAGIHYGVSLSNGGVIRYTDTGYLNVSCVR